MKLEKSLRRVREVITRPHNFYAITQLDSFDDYLPDPTSIYFAVGDGLVIYEPKGYTVEMVTALSKGDLPEKPIQGLYEQWAYLASLGYHTVYSIVYDGHPRSGIMCRAAGMEKETHDKFSIYKKVIYGLKT